MPQAAQANGSRLTIAAIISMIGLGITVAGLGVAAKGQLSDAIHMFDMRAAKMESNMETINRNIERLASASVPKATVMLWIEQLKGCNPNIKVPDFPQWE